MGENGTDDEPKIATQAVVEAPAAGDGAQGAPGGVDWHETALVLQERHGLPVDQAQVGVWSKLMQVVDRAPLGENGDFCMIVDKRGGNHIEIQRDFALKAVALARLNYEPMGQAQVVPDGKHFHIIVTMKVTDTVRGVSAAAEGSSNTRETETSGARAFHDALGRAETRALKRALESVVGLPFVNAIIKELFGGFNVKTGPKNVTPRGGRKQAAPPADRMKALRARIAKLPVTRAEKEAEWNRVLAASGTPDGLALEEKRISRLEEDLR